MYKFQDIFTTSDYDDILLLENKKMQFSTVLLCITVDPCMYNTRGTSKNWVIYYYTFICNEAPFLRTKKIMTGALKKILLTV